MNEEFYKKNNLIQCLECGKYFKRPCAHVRQVHNMSAREYKVLHGLDVKRGILSNDDREIMKRHTFENGTVDNLKNGIQFRFKKGETHNYKRSAQTIERLRSQYKNMNRRFS